MTVDPAVRFCVTNAVETDVPEDAVAAVLFDWRTTQTTAHPSLGLGQGGAVSSRRTA